MKFICIILCICLFGCVQSNAEVLNLDRMGNDQERMVYESSIIQLDKFSAVMKERSSLKFAIDMKVDSTTISLLEDLNYSDPKYIILLLPNSQFNASSVLKQNNIPASMLTSRCFDLFFDTNDVLSDGNFAIWSSRNSLFDIVEKNGFPSIAYAVFVYEKESPQVAVAFSCLKENIVLTQTGLIYNTNMFPDEIYMALPYCADVFWKNMDTLIYSLE